MASPFAYDKIRPMQDILLSKIEQALQQRKSLIAHAPTGLGKTAAALSPAVPYAKENNLAIFFLTSRHTQHAIVIETLKELEDKGVQVQAASIIGKKHFCLQPGIDTLRSRDFHEFCKAMITDKKCEFYESVRKEESLSASTKLVLHQLKGISTTEDVLREAKQYALCPYEIALLHAKQANVIICDYSYLFNPSIRQAFLKKIGKELHESIIIVDEAHNLPERVKDAESDVLSSIIIARALNEARKFKHEKLVPVLQSLQDLFEKYALRTGTRTLDAFEEKTDVRSNECYITKDEFFIDVDRIYAYDDLLELMHTIADSIREAQKVSYIGAVAGFLSFWQGDDEGHTRIFSVHETPVGKMLLLHYRCLDPGLVTKAVFSQAHASILMSGTLTPTSMYKELLGIDDAIELTLESPFPQQNQCNIIIPHTTTKFSVRSQEQYANIAHVAAKATNAIPGNVALFFPSYFLLEKIYEVFGTLTNKTCFVEKPLMTKTEKADFLERFKQYKDTGAALLGVITGSFGEGIDLPGDFLKGVIVIGLPLQKPTLETKALIAYYDEKFGKGWEYGYVYPAFNKTLQSAGRCIRSEQDKGVIVFLDERYAWPQYFKLFPKDKQLKVTMLYEKMIREFFRP
ncbi:MAG: ATP-dependent DNA helicase [archaeon]